MFRTFKASIETQIESDLLQNGVVFNFNPHNPWTAEYIIQNITSEIFEFSKEDILFSTRQKRRFKNYLKLNPFSGGLFADGVKYKLNRIHERGKTNYIIEVDGDHARLKLNWLNRQKIEWVHGRKVSWEMIVAIATVLILLYYILTFFIPIKSKNV